MEQYPGQAVTQDQIVPEQNYAYDPFQDTQYQQLNTQDGNEAPGTQNNNDQSASPQEELDVPKFEQKKAPKNG